jgi:diguanylate cyclase (GGDEF)-like protein
MVRPLVAFFVAALVCVTVAKAAEPSENRWLWSDPSIVLNGVPITAYHARNDVSVAFPAQWRLVIPFDPRWQRSPWFIATDYWIDRGTLTYMRTSGGMGSVPLGMLIPVAQRPIKRAIPTIQIPPDVAPGTPIILTLESEVDTPRLVIVSARELAKLDADERRTRTYPLLLICGLLTALALSNLIYFGTSRDRSYVYYFFVMVTAAIITLREAPDAFWGWVFPWLALPFPVVELVTECAFAIALVAFARDFLSMRKYRSRFDIPLLAMTGIYLVLMIVDELVYDAYWTNRAIDVTLMSVFALVLAAGIEAHRRRHEAALYYIIAFSGVLGGLLAYTILKVFFHIWLWPIGVVGISWEGFWLTAALADRLRKLNQARDNERSARIAEQEFAAIHDPLTGLYNRRKIEVELRELEEQPRTAGQDALVYLDVDHFKVINDTSGHEAGDQLLVQLAGTIRDAVQPNDVVARVGGDEFAVLLRDRHDGEILATAERMRDAIARAQFSVGSNRFPISASIGCALVRDVPPSSILGLADAACSQAKDAGRNRIEFVSDERSAESARRQMMWSTRISGALQGDRLRLYGQSIVPLREGLARGRHIEVLLRMCDGDGSVVEPSHFLPAAERYDLTAKLDRWVIAKALPVLHPLVASGEIESIAINLSGSSLREEGLAQFILEQLRSSGIPPSTVCFEITETVVASALDALGSLTGALRALGVRFALDDFGTGTSSLSLLRRLQVDYLKIDGSFVRDCAVNPVDAAMVEAICGLAKVLGLQTVAEYAVSDAVVAQLREIGVDFAQGWAFDRAQCLEPPIGAHAPC